MKSNKNDTKKDGKSEQMNFSSKTPENTQEEGKTEEMTQGQQQTPTQNFRKSRYYTIKSKNDKNKQKEKKMKEDHNSDIDMENQSDRSNSRNFIMKPKSQKSESIKPEFNSGKKRSRIRNQAKNIITYETQRNSTCNNGNGRSPEEDVGQNQARSEMKKMR